jgi:hypothetical protein
VRAHDSFVHASRETEVIGIYDQSLHCGRKIFRQGEIVSRGSDSASCGGKRKGVFGEPRQFSRQLSLARSINCECSVKVFNSSVENHVEKAPAQIETARQHEA